MTHAIVLQNYDGRQARVYIRDEIVDNLYLVLHYFISGDEVYVFVTDDGAMHVFDANDCVPNTPDRIVDCGPDDLDVIFPEDMKWEKINEA